MRRDEGSVLVTDSSLRTALFVIRSLGVHGVRITAAERPTPRGLDLGGLSRYVERRLTVPDNRTDPDSWCDAVLDAAAQHTVLMPMGMHAIGPVCRRLDEFQRVTRVALPSWDTVRQADDTPRLLELARRLDIPTPRDFSDSSEIPSTAFPVIVKIGVEAGLPPGDRYRIVRHRQELADAVAHFKRFNPRPIVQELIVGDGIGYEALYDFQHRQVAAFCHRRLREYPVTGGPSTYCESIHEPRAAEYSRRLLDELRWTGLAMVEFKIDSRTGEPILMEINPRPWGSMALPIRAGVDFPWLTFLLARDGRVESIRDWPDGVRLRYLLNDVPAVAAELRRARSWRRRAAIIGSLLDPRVKEGVLSFDDLRPTWAYLTKGIRRVGAAGRA